MDHSVDSVLSLRNFGVDAAEHVDLDETDYHMADHAEQIAGERETCRA